jgi:hypothetical protein
MSRHSKLAQLAPAGAPLRHVGLITERIHDAYRSHRKPRAPTVCPECGLAFADGRWQQPRWPMPAAAQGAHEQLCPACRRAREHLPAGYLHLGGDFLAAHRDEVINAVRRCEARARAERPLQRIVAIAAVPESLLVTTTDQHLARRIGQSLQRAWRGRLAFHYEAGQPMLRVHWER